MGKFLWINLIHNRGQHNLGPGVMQRESLDHFEFKTFLKKKVFG
jgi:hypothetical protein